MQKTQNTPPAKDRLWTRDYIFICLAAFLLSFSFFLLVPTLPFYLRDTFGIGQSMVGVVLSCYTIAVLCVRPFSGFMADTFPRKRVYVIAYSLFVATFFGYLCVTTVLAAFVALRIFHGFTFGALTTTGNTLVIDIMPSSRRGEGLGYYGVMGNMAMAFGPMAGLFIISSGNYDLLFWSSIASGGLGLMFGSMVRAPRKAPAPQPNPAVSIDRFFLVEGIPACIAFFMLAIPYGMTSSYVALYAERAGITSSSGLFFTVMALGLVSSRLNSGKRVDRGLVTQTIRAGIVVALVGVAGEALLSTVAGWSTTAGYVLYFATALMIGYGYGTMFPAYNTLFINLAPNSRRATANATYLTGWDVGIGCGMLIGGWLSERSFALCYAVGAVLVALALVWFVVRVTPHFNKHKLR